MLWMDILDILRSGLSCSLLLREWLVPSSLADLRNLRPAILCVCLSPAGIPYNIPLYAPPRHNGLSLCWYDSYGDY